MIKKMRLHSKSLETGFNIFKMTSMGKCKNLYNTSLSLHMITDQSASLPSSRLCSQDTLLQ